MKTNLISLFDYLYNKYPKRFTLGVCVVFFNIFCVMYFVLDLVDKFLG